MFAPNHHPAMKNVAPVRREMGVKTIFNMLGPLTNPAGAPNILMGVFHPDLVGIQVRALQRLGAEHALVVYGKDGMDEVSVWVRPRWWANSKTARSPSTKSTPKTLAWPWPATARFKVETPEQSQAPCCWACWTTQTGPAKDIVVLNAGVALYAANVANSMQAGIH